MYYNKIRGKKLHYTFIHKSTDIQSFKFYLKLTVKLKTKCITKI